MTMIRLAFLTLLIALLLMPICSLAASDSDDVQVTVTVEEVLAVEYTGDPDITFYIDEDDLNEGSQGQVNLGDLNWWSNVAPWEIWVVRTEWELSDYGVLLQLKWGPEDNSPWHTVLTDPGDVWETGNETGSGTFGGVDWKVKCLTWEIPPGTYTCTVTFTISPDTG